MPTIYINVLTQVIILLILIFVGFFFEKLKILNDTAVKSVTDIVLFAVTPCVIIKSFADREYTPSLLKALLLSIGWAVAIHLLFIAIAHLVIRTKNVSAKRVLIFSTVFSNCGFMSIPLQQAVLGTDGVFFAASYVAIFNVFMWSYGSFVMSGDKKVLLSKKAVINPGVLSVAIGIIIFILSVPIPKIVYEPISYMAAFNTPLPMIIIGYHLSKSSFFKTFKDISALWCIALRLVITPLLALGIMWLCGLRGTLLVSLAISTCAPIAAAATMFAQKFDGDTALSANIVSLSTVLSVITMPLIITFASLIS